MFREKHQPFGSVCPIPPEIRVDIILRVQPNGAVTLAPMMAAVPHQHTPTGSEAVVARIQPADMTISQAIEAWGRDMARRNRRPTSIERMTGNVRAAAACVGWGRVVDITLDSAGEYLSGKREDGWSPGTHDTALASLKAFSRFLHKSKRLPDDPLAMLARCGDEPGGGARAATTDEVRGLILAATFSMRKDRRAKGNRALFWAFLAYTGMRMDAEAARVRWRDVFLDDEHPHILTAPERSKNRRTMRIVLHPQLVLYLRRHRKTVRHGPDDPVFPIVPNRHSFALDRGASGAAYQDQRGRQFSAHSLRKWLATELDRAGASPGVVSRILRHAGSLTEARYIDPDIRAEVAAVQELPNILPENDPEKLDSGTEIVDTPPVADHDHPHDQHDSDSGACPAVGLRHIPAARRPPDPETLAGEQEVGGGSARVDGALNCPLPGSSERVDSDLVKLLENQAQTLIIVANLLRGGRDGYGKRTG